MNDNTKLILATTLSITSRLRTQANWTEEKWFDIADELEKAVRAARAEGNRLSRLKGDR